MIAQIQTSPIRRAKRRSTGGAEVDPCRDPKARGRRGPDQDRETRGRREVGLGIGEIGRGPGAEAEIGGGTGVEIESRAGAGIEGEAGAEATEEVGRGPGPILPRRARVTR